MYSIISNKKIRLYLLEKFKLSFYLCKSKLAPAVMHRTEMLTVVLTISLKCLGMKVFSLIDLTV